MSPVIKIIKKIIFSSFLLYGYNLIAVNFNMIIPINIYTVLFVSILGFPSVLALILFKVFILWGVFVELTVSKKNFYNIVHNIVQFNKISHAYIVEIGDYQQDFACILDFVKLILNNGNNNSSNIDEMIDNNCYPDLRIIEADGNVIKKKQLIELQDEFKNKSFLNNKMIYIIKDADKLNDASGNTILKFLEEPEDDIIAILVTKNRYKIIDTILSRCQILSLVGDNNIFDTSDTILELIKFIINGDELFINYQYIVDNILIDKNVAIDVLMKVQSVLIKYLNFTSNKNGVDCSVDVINLLDLIDVNKITDFIAIIEEEVQKLNFNVNYKLWLDCLFARLIGG